MPSVNAINLVVRFFLEIAALIAMGMLGWSLGEGLLGYVLAGAIPIAAATFWGVFAVPNDPSRSGNAPVPISGALRLLLEFLFFAAGFGSFMYLNESSIAWVFVVIVLVHYAVSYKRVRWLLQ
ncbi:YrdB family protein [Leucothrix arctica]|uniref:DUF2568 domain-containing protein n=1 Tax=Leucothrix arctica TaxID=1481894 RepID=A0A317CAL9_9GAMM|nr:YrdB family protein [Leucothrix arctica]PWQ93420.1 hypothetical protein DKT75_17475 [Leucothrix arctica]